MSHTITACSQCGLEYASGEVFCPNDGARLAPKHDSVGQTHRRSEADALLNQVLGGRYKIIRKIGEGGMGIVYEAEHVMIEKRVGLKVLREDFSSREDVVERFRQEAKSASRIGHPNIIDISDFGVTPSGANYFVMELLSGHDLATELEKNGPLSAQRTITLAVQCARALGAAHAKGIVHRDMKPENIFLLRRESAQGSLAGDNARFDDFVKIVDFGIAKMSDIETEGQPGRKLTKTGMIFGTPEYMSPEQAGGKKLDHRVDIYAMGIILYELLTGRVPFVGDTFMGILTQHMFETAAPISAANPSAQVPPELERIIFKALAKNADDRHQSMDELATDLLSVLGQAPSMPASLAPPPGTFTHPGYQEQRGSVDLRAPRLHVATPATELTPEKRSSFGPMAWVAVAVALLGGGFFAMRGGGEQSAQAPAASAPTLPAPAPAPPSAPLPVAPQPAPSTHVTVHVESDPEGARVVTGGREVCSGTPCEFPAERGKEIEVEFSKNGYRSITKKLMPQAETNQISIELKKRERAASPGSSRPSGDLKIPDAFSSGR